MRALRAAGLTGLLLITGCKPEQKTPEPANVATPAATTMDLLAQGSPLVCTAEDVKQTLLALMKPDTSGVKALANSGSYAFHATDVDAFAEAITYAVNLETLASVNRSIKSVKCDAQVSIAAPAYHLQTPAPIDITYEVRPAIEDPTSFIISANSGEAKAAAQDIFAGIIEQIQQHAADAAAQKTAAGEAAFDSIANSAAPAAANASTSPSFDCARVKSQVLKTICGNPDLVALDNQLTTAYQTAIAAADQSNDPTAHVSLVNAEKVWIAQRQQCGDAACITAAYNSRLQQLHGTQ